VCAGGQQDLHEDGVEGVAGVVRVQGAHHQRAHADRGHEVGRAEDDRLDARAGGGDVVDVDEPLRGLDLRLDADPADLEPGGLLDLGQQQVQRAHLTGVGDLRQHDAVQVGAGALDDLDHVAVGPLRRPVVDPDGADLLAPAALVQRRDDVLAGAGLGQRRARVLQVQEHLVGGQALGLLRNRGLLPGTARLERRDRSSATVPPLVGIGSTGG
jgi:hypothetical protein